MRTLVLLLLSAAALAQQPSKPASQRVAAAVEASKTDINTNAAPAPFGFTRGMTKQQIIAAVGRQSVLHEAGDVLILSTAPSAHPDFSDYTVLVSPKAGLVKILATTNKIATSGSGDEVKAKFAEMRSALEKRYGQP